MSRNSTAQPNHKWHSNSTLQLSKTLNLPTLRYRTTRPLIPLTPARQAISATIPHSTPPLTIQLRRFEPGDLAAAHRLRTQHDVMIHTSQAGPDTDLAASQKWMDRFLPPNDVNTFDLMLWAKETTNNDASTSTENPHDDSSEAWEHIGTLGMHTDTPIPHLGYMIRTEFWGKGIATAATCLFLRLWWDLPRRDIIVNLADSRDGHDTHLMMLEYQQDGTEADSGIKVVPEVLLAEVEKENKPSHRVVEKCGFREVGWEEVEVDVGKFVLLDYILIRPQ